MHQSVSRLEQTSNRPEVKALYSVLAESQISAERLGTISREFSTPYWLDGISPKNRCTFTVIFWEDVN
jgi:hypothetical protein